MEELIKIHKKVLRKTFSEYVDKYFDENDEWRYGSMLFDIKFRDGQVVHIDEIIKRSRKV